MISVDKQLQVLKRGAVEIIREEELRSKLERAVSTRNPLVIKAGFDPTAPDIHLGHTVLLRKLRHFQDCGHKVVFLIGDATALVGDPSGQSQMRKIMTWEDVLDNAKTYEKQVGKILKMESECFVRMHNSEWFPRQVGMSRTKEEFTFDGFVNLAQKYTVARLLERDDFEKRLKENRPISFLELFYPLMQGYDSIKLEADVELGGTDQKFNMLVGRNLQQAYKHDGEYKKDAQVVMTMPLLEGIDGVDKMSKSLGNYIGIDEAPGDMFGKVMSISDEMMMKYYELLTDIPVDKIKRDIDNGKLHPKKAKSDLAGDIVRQYHGKEKALKASKDFESIFAEGKNPDDMPEISVNENIFALTALLKTTKLVDSSSEIKRLIKQGAVSVDGKKILNAASKIEITGSGVVVRIGKRKFAKVKKSPNIP